MDEELDQADLSSSKSNDGGAVKKLFIIIGIGALVVLLLIGGIVAMLLSGGDDKAPSQSAEQQMMGDDRVSSDDFVNVNVKKTYLKVGPLYELPLYTLNLLTTKGKRYLRVRMNFELSNEALQGEISLKQAAVSDIILSVFSSKTVEDLSSIKGKARVKRELIKTINKSLLDGKVKNVFFTEFIIQ